MIKHIDIFTDGSCNWKTRQGGAGVYMITEADRSEYFFRKGYSNTTIGRMELRAFLHALELLSEHYPCEVVIYSDSKYVVNGFISHMQTLSSGGFLPPDIVNYDIWKAILDISFKKRNTDLKIKVKHIKGHQKKPEANDITYGNAVADILANYKTQIRYLEDEMEYVSR